MRSLGPGRDDLRVGPRGGKILVQRAPTCPSSPGWPISSPWSAPTRRPAAYTQRYFGSRGVVRVYGTELTDGHLDPLADHAGLHAADDDPEALRRQLRRTAGRRISGRCEKAPDGDWELDFELSYVRA